jgi:histidinol phosphatase-like PHP family hydrolase
VSLTIAAIADIHFARRRPDDVHRTDIADILLQRAVRRINRFVRPDVTLVLGDVVDDGRGPEAGERLRKARQVLDSLESPAIVIPGNHDPEPDVFYSVFDRPPEFLDVDGVRFVPFLDRPEPEYNASRSAEDVERMRRTASGFDGPLVAVQHVPVFPPGASDCPYNYLNVDDVLGAMAENGYRLAIAGHWHEGMDPVTQEGMAFVAAPTLCRSPFSFATIALDDGRASVTRHALRLPDGLQLADTHVHSQFAYCSVDMDARRAIDVGEAFGLDGVVFAEHSGQLYFDQEAYWRGDWFERGLAASAPEDDRFDAYVSTLRAAGCPKSRIGLELDCDATGSAVLRPGDRAKVGFVMGSIHQLQALRRKRKDVHAAADEYLGLLEPLLASGIRVLAHPFRIFSRRGTELPVELFAPVVEILRRQGVAAEVNFHNNEPPADFVRMCLEAGVRLAFGSDSHDLCDVGEFTPHLAFLRKCGYDGDVADVLIDPPWGDAEGECR